MRLVSYESDGVVRPGVLFDAAVYDVAKLSAASAGSNGRSHGSQRELLETHGKDLPALAATLQAAARETDDARIGDLADVRLGPPVPDPSKVLCVGMNYRDHVAETGRALPEHPDIFSKFATSLIGPAEDLCVSEVSSKLDYEGELAVVIGSPCRRVSPEEAFDKVAGAMILNDTTARDLQFNGTQWLAGKAVDGSTPCGPALVTLDELGDPHDLNLVTRVNGVEVQRSNTGRMIFTIAEIISYVSQFLMLRTGDVISTGTPDGVGSRMDPPSWLTPGDVVEVEIDGLGVIRNTVR
jgi:2-keto-4-pentenoate hydratase/2-oxohepta-3-ene-1,7-dioic acid hydratase in catechol pathway